MRTLPWLLSFFFCLAVTEVDCFVFHRRTSASSIKHITGAPLFSTSADVLNPRAEGLALMLDDGTRKSHSIAESTAFVSGFFKGLSTKEAYRNLLVSLYFVYEAMEEAFDNINDKNVQALDDSKLRRVEALQQDMKYFFGDDSWRQMIRPSPATQAYVARIQKIAKGPKPYLLIGHQYSRYLGDLFGGQMMGSMARKSLDLAESRGTAFYQFDEIENSTGYITEWYTKLNGLDLTDAQRQEIVDEANYVFALNIALFDELEGSPWKALWTLAIVSFKVKLGLT